MKITSCTVTLRENLVPKGSEDKYPAWLRANVSIVLDDLVTLNGIFIRDSVADSEVFMSYACSGAYVLSPIDVAVLENPIITAYQRTKYPWLANHPAPLHSLTLEILSGFREYYDYATDIPSTQLKVDEKVRKLLRKTKHWSQDDYLSIKDKVEPILVQTQKLLDNQEAEEEVP
jgi:hypothetical protein